MTVLSAREQELLALVAAGLANRAIARQLHYSESTVKNALTRILNKLGAESRTAAAAYWWRQNPDTCPECGAAPRRRDQPNLDRSGGNRLRP